MTVPVTSDSMRGINVSFLNVGTAIVCTFWSEYGLTGPIWYPRQPDKQRQSPAAANRFTEPERRKRRGKALKKSQAVVEWRYRPDHSKKEQSMSPAGAKPAEGAKRRIRREEAARRR